MESTYIIVPAMLILVGIGLISISRKKLLEKVYLSFAHTTIICAIVSFGAVGDGTCGFAISDFLPRAFGFGALSLACFLVAHWLNERLIRMENSEEELND